MTGIVPAALGEAATRLSWLAPGASSLVALARSPGAPAWAELRFDPGAVLLVVRQASATLQNAPLSFFPALLQEAAVAEGALRQLASGETGFVDWNQAEATPIYRASVVYARLAEFIARQTGRCDPDNAWVAGLLAPLGWLAVAAVSPKEAAACLAEPEFSRQPHLTQERRWGFDQAAIARRLARRWRLPTWLTAVVGHLGLPVDTAQALGADVDLFHGVQWAVAEAQRQGFGLNLAVGAASFEAAQALGMTAAQGEAASRVVKELANELLPRREWLAPSKQPLLPELLGLALENRRLRDTQAFACVERDVDDLQRAVEDQRAGEAAKLQAQKLGALAEFAAGAGHEINNPLAVISGQAQYLLGYEEVPARQRALEAIVGQTQRVHQILSELMQFARPARPQKQPVDLANVLREVAGSLRETSERRRVRLVCPELEALTLDADPKQLRTALTCLLRNAIEAAPPDGWAGFRVETPVPHRVEIYVEDNGKGPAPSSREHLFDPFYSGRSAGRGRGLGLPTAWRLAREQGGDVCFADVPGGPTRFILSLPREAARNGTPANSALRIAN